MAPRVCDIARAMRTTWRFLLGAVIGVGLGYATVLLVQPRFSKAPRKHSLRTIYEVPAERENTPTAA